MKKHSWSRGQAQVFVMNIKEISSDVRHFGMESRKIWGPCRKLPGIAPSKKGKIARIFLDLLILTTDWTYFSGSLERFL